MRQCGGNVTSAVEMLEREETAMLDQFETAVKDMVSALHHITGHIDTGYSSRMDFI